MEKHEGSYRGDTRFCQGKHHADKNPEYVTAVDWGSLNDGIRYAAADKTGHNKNCESQLNHHIGDNDAGAGIDQIEVFDVHEHRNRDRLHRDHHT